MGKGRYVECQVLYDGQERGLSRKLEALDYTDNASGKSDEIALTFHGKDRDWLMTDFIPEKGHDLDVTLWYHNWNRDGDLLRYHCGNFTLDDITYSGAPGRCLIRGVSIPASTLFQEDRQSRTWKQVTLKQIALEMMEKYGMRDLFYWGAEPVLETVEQDSQADSTFLYELCEREGMFLKVYKKALVIFDKAVYEPRGITGRFTERDFDGDWEWNSTLNGTYTGAVISYTSPEPKKGGKKGAAGQTTEVTVGGGPRLLHINEKADSEGEAQRIARARVNRENEKAVTLSFTAMSRPDIVATCNIELYGLGRCSGKYFVNQVKHRVSGGGCSMHVSGYRIFDRI